MNLPRTRRGERHPRAQLKLWQVKEARRLDAEDVPTEEIHRRLHLTVTVECLRQAIRGVTWAGEESELTPKRKQD